MNFYKDFVFFLRDPPENGRDFKKFLMHQKKDQKSFTKRIQNYEILHKFKFAVFALGNTSYPNFCEFGKFVDCSLNEMGAERLCELGEGDELNGQEESFKQWCREVYTAATTEFCIDTTSTPIPDLLEDNLTWSTQKVRISTTPKSLSIGENLRKLHDRKIESFRLLSKNVLSDKYRKTLLVELQADVDDFKYRPGDHIGIFAENRRDLVDQILPRLINANVVDEPIQIEKLKTTILGRKNF